MGGGGGGKRWIERTQRETERERHTKRAVSVHFSFGNSCLCIFSAQRESISLESITAATSLTV